MKKILITGSNGQLGNSIKKLENEYPNFSFIYTDVADLDITNKQDVIDFFEEGKFTDAINCAAYTAVDKAEEEYELAKKINAIGPTNMASAARKTKCQFYHISTDYVFNGKGHVPYKEENSCQPPSAYGKTKLIGEEMVNQVNEKAIIIRTSWLYSEFGHNFMKSMLKFGKERDELRVVFDQIGTPTYATDLARAILDMIKSGKIASENPVYHFSNEGVASWYDFALEIMQAAKLECNVSPIESHEYPLPAPRPFYSVMNKAKIKKDFDVKIPHWRTSMLQCLDILKPKG